MKKLALLLMVLFLACSCGHREGIIQRSDKSYLQFIGNPEEATVRVDEAAPFTVKTDENKLYQVSPGKHTIAVSRNGRLLVNWAIFVQSQTTLEVDVP